MKIRTQPAYLETRHKSMNSFRLKVSPCAKKEASRIKKVGQCAVLPDYLQNGFIFRTWRENQRESMIFDIFQLYQAVCDFHVGKFLVHIGGLVNLNSPLDQRREVVLSFHTTYGNGDAFAVDCSLSVVSVLILLPQLLTLLIIEPSKCGEPSVSSLSQNFCHYLWSHQGQYEE